MHTKMHQTRRNNSHKIILPNNRHKKMHKRGLHNRAKLGNMIGLKICISFSLNNYMHKQRHNTRHHNTHDKMHSPRRK